MSLAEFAGDTPQQSDDLPTMPREVMEGEEDFRYERGGGHRGREGDRYDRGPRSGHSSCFVVARRPGSFSFRRLLFGRLIFVRLEAICQPTSTAAATATAT